RLFIFPISSSASSPPPPAAVAGRRNKQGVPPHQTPGGPCGWVSYTGRFHESAPPVRRNSSTTGFVLQISKKVILLAWVF
ncbi:unnamed protein product, partial [Musa acuminata var. zebrina]